MKKTLGSKIINIIFTIISLVIILKLFGIYKMYSYNEFIKGESIARTTTFSRDKDTTYSYKYSYKLESKNFNDAVFYKTIKVKPNTP